MGRHKSYNKPEYKEKLRKSTLSRKWKGKNNPNWKGGIVKTSNGYMWEYCPHHPFADKRGYVLQHRLIMEKYIKRFLLSIEVVHHLNEVRDDNRIENLQLLFGLGEHNTIHKTKREDLK